MKPSQLIDPADRLRIEAAVLEAERHTSGEIVVAVVHACDEYGSAGWRCGALLAALAFLGLAVFAPPLHAATYLGVQAAALGLGHLLTRADTLRRLFVSDGLFAEQAARRASASFAEHGLRHTEGKTGILIFVALLEHRVIVLGDEAIDRALGPEESWQEVVDTVLDGIRRGEAVDGLLGAIRRCGEILRKPLPALTDDRDEITRTLILED